nr:MAG TPA: 4Fe-4S single cluster domain protein [Caudoviricetes sp.]
MRYAQIRSMDISNGEGVGVSLFVQGCPFHCFNCFNSETWDFNGGKEWTEEIKDKFMKIIDRPYIKRVSFLGGECLAEQNLDGILDLIKEIRSSFPEKTIWLYTGFTWEDIMYRRMPHPPKYTQADFLQWNKRKEIISLCNVVVDGEYIDEQRNLSKKWAGSDNQRVISVQESLAQNKVVLYCD